MGLTMETDGDRGKGWGEMVSSAVTPRHKRLV